MIQRKKHAFLEWMKNKDNELLKDRFKMRSKEVKKAIRERESTSKRESTN